MQKELAQFCMAETHPIFDAIKDSESRAHSQSKLDAALGLSQGLASPSKG